MDDQNRPATSGYFPEQGAPLPDAVILRSATTGGSQDDMFTSAPSSGSTMQEKPLSVPDTTEVRSGAEFGMTRFCEQAFTSPASAPVGSRAILAAFDDSGLWLASLVQPAHLVAELRQQCCLLTRVVITQWTRQGETHKLVRLAEALLEAQPPVLSHEAGQIMALLASLVGILRPAHAPRWLNASRPLLRDSVDPHLLKEAEQWVNVGQMLASLPQEDRLFWNRRLRDPEHDWEWESPEALDALGRIPPLLNGDAETILLFQATVPRCWWELWREQQQAQIKAAGAKSRLPGQAHPLSTFALGLITGIGCMILAGWWATSKIPASLAGSTAAPILETATAVPEPPAFTFHAVEVTPSPSPSVAAPADAATPSSPAAIASVQSVTKAPPLSPPMQARREEAARISASMPDLNRIYNLVRTGSEREAMPHVQGRTTMAAQGSKEHRALLRWLMLDPPVDPAVRTLAAKAAVRVLNAPDMFDTLQLCLHPGSPNLKEARECAELLLALGSQGLSEVQKQKLTAQSALGMGR